MNMLKQIQDWLAAHRQRRNEHAYDAGYDWAMRTLRGKGDETLTSDQIYDRCSEPFDGPNPFDRGAVRATHEFELATIKLLPDEA
jgi:hypothetical protein